MWCQVCGAELRSTWWKRLCGFDPTLCEDPVACVVRFRVALEASSESEWGPVRLAAGPWLQGSHRGAAGQR